jgi:hypothetical protein
MGEAYQQAVAAPDPADGLATDPDFRTRDTLEEEAHEVGAES